MSRLERVNRRTNKKNPRLFLYLLIALFLLFIIYVVLSGVLKKAEQIITSPLPSLFSNNTILPTPEFKESADLAVLVEKSLAGSSGTYGIVIKNLKNKQSYYLNENRAFDSASLYKLWVMATAYQQIKDGILSEDEIISESVSALNSKYGISNEQAERTEGIVTLSVRDALYKMITISDNYAALLLSSKVGLSNVTIFLQKNGLFESKIGTSDTAPNITPFDAALFFEKLYSGKLINREYSDKMLDTLKDQQLNNKIPSSLSKDLVIAHKTGELGVVSHDAGIVYSPKGDYVIVVLSETNSQVGANARIANISKEAYDFFIN